MTPSEEGTNWLIPQVAKAKKNSIFQEIEGECVYSSDVISFAREMGFYSAEQDGVAEMAKGMTPSDRVSFLTAYTKKTAIFFVKKTVSFMK